GDVLLTIGLGALNPGYSHLRQFISELGEAGRPLAWLFAVWSVTFGVLFAAFSLGLLRSLKGRPGARAGGAALFAVALGSAVGGSHLNSAVAPGRQSPHLTRRRGSSYSIHYAWSKRLACSCFAMHKRDACATKEQPIMGRAKITIVGAGNVGATCAHWCAAAE